MALKLEDKKSVVAAVNEIAQVAVSAVVADYRMITAVQMTTLRSDARRNKVYVKIVRNTLARRALVDTNFECLTDALIGPSVLFFSQEDPGSAARVLKNFVKEHEIETLKVRALSIGGQLLAANQLDSMAKLPTIDGARAILLGVMLAPVVKLARLLNEIPATVTRVVAAVAEKKKSD